MTELEGYCGAVESRMEALGIKEKLMGVWYIK